MAIQYLTSVIGDDRWKRTKDNEAGHDGCLCIYYDGRMTEWWMEAKYSLLPNNLSRGRLDATIIEVLLNKNKYIERLYVITNCDISVKIKSDIERVVTDNSTCHNVEFITKDLLELWLIKNYDIYTEYFENPIPKSELFLSSELFITKDLEIYDIMTSQGLRQEVQRVLYPQKRYNLYFSVYSKDSVTLRIDSKYFMFNKNNEYITLKSGINEYKITAVFSCCEKKYGENVGIKLHDEQRGKTISCQTSYSINTSDSKSVLNFTASQKECLSSIRENINESHKNFQLFSIYGNSGMGKTFMIDHIIDEISENSMIEFEAFTDDPYINAKHILRTLLYIYFPYAYGDNISESMREVIRNNFNSGAFLYKLSGIDVANQPELLLSLFRETCDMYLFPRLNNSYKQYIIWDDVSKLDCGLLRFITLFIKQLECHDENISFIIIHNHLMNNLSALTTCEHEINITADDVESIFGIKFSDEDIQKFFPDLLTIYDLKEFITNYDLPINDINDFKLNYLKFLYGEGKSTLVERKMLGLSSKESLVLNRIYYSYSGISREECMRENNEDEMSAIIFKLINYNLIKYNHEQKLVSYHDVYLKHYKKTNKFDEQALNVIGAKNKEEILKNQLLSLNEDNSRDYCIQIETLLNNQEFSSVYFILEDLLRYRDIITVQIGLEPYLQLKYYRIYADANVKMSNRTAYSQFTELWDEVRDIIPSLNNYKLILHTLYELSNAAYDNFDYNKCFELKNNANNLEARMKKLGYSSSLSDDIDFCYNEIDYMVLLAKSELGKDVDYDVKPNCEGVYRLKRSQCTNFNNIQKFIAVAKKTLTFDCYHNNFKHYVKADFDITFLETVIQRNSSLWFEILVQKRKKLNGINYGYYIKATHSIISVLLNLQLYDMAENMFDVMILGNNQNPRMQFFDLEIQSAIYIYKDDIFAAITNLDKQLKLCTGVPSYEKIVKHNLLIVKKHLFNGTFQFYLNPTDLESNAFLLDPRCFY